MSHGSTSKCEPNFTPMLDMILQLVMFFMLCTNFVQEQTSEKIKLPEAIEAKSIDRFVDMVIYLNIDKDGKVILPASGKDPKMDILTNAQQVQTYMTARMSEYKASLKPKDRDNDKTPTVILRADKECEWKKVYDTMAACKRAKYSDVQLRVQRANDKK
jgi:biopolymer transport protein ExbD